MAEETLFEAALAVPETERGVFLDRECGADTNLRARVDALLAAYDAPGGIFDRPAAEENPPAPSDVTAFMQPNLKPDVVIGGRYTLLEKIGEGGMGEVWVAKQSAPVKRRVALKLIKTGMDSKAVLSRFEQERQALAMMDHPNIAKVLDGGMTPTGQPFFVMELVNGLPLVRYCNEAKLTPRQRLELFLPICHAVQHAHQKGIIHRDLKPANILVGEVDGSPVPKVIDFGVAKATAGKLTDESMFTQFGAIVGTLEYMAPEQAGVASEDIDTRADIYSLGVILYELLTGLKPIDARRLKSTALLEMIRVIKEEEPLKPSTRISTGGAANAGGAGALPALAMTPQIDPKRLAAMLRGDLDCVVMKCLEKNRSRRYETASGLAADIKRHLANEPISARPPSLAYRLQKAWRRNRLAYSAACAVTVALVIGFTVSVYQAVRASNALKDVALERDQKNNESIRATAAEKLAKDETARAVAALTQVAAERDEKEKERKKAEAISTFLGDVFKSPDPTRDGRTIKVAELLDKAAKKLETDLAAQPAERAQLQATLGRTYASLGLHRQAIPLLEQARDYCLATAGPEHPSTLAAMTNLAHCYVYAQRPEEALKLREKVLAIEREVNGPEHPSTLSAMNWLATSYADSGRQGEALKMHEDVLSLSRKVNGPEDPCTLSAMANLAISYSQAGRKDDALKLREEALPLFRKVLGPEHPDTGTSIGNLAIDYAQAGRHTEALKLREETLALSLKVLGPEHVKTLSDMRFLAESYKHVGRLDDAIKLSLDALAISRKAFGENGYVACRTMAVLADLYAAANRRNEANSITEELLAIESKISTPDRAEILGALTNLAIEYNSAERLSDAIALQEKTLAIKRRVLPPNHHYLPIAMGNLAELYEKSGRYDASFRLWEDTLALCRTSGHLEHPMALHAMEWLADSYRRTGRMDDSARMWEQILPLRSKVLGAENVATLGAMTNLAIAYRESKRLPEAIDMQEKALAIKRRVLAPYHDYLINAMTHMARLYGLSGRHQEAFKLGDELLALHRKAQGAELSRTLVALESVAINYEASGQTSDAIKIREEVLASYRRLNHPEICRALNTLAWTLATCQDNALRNPRRATELAAEAVKLRPEDPSILNTLGITQYRAEDYPAAIATLERSGAFKKGVDACDGFFLAMARWKMGQTEKAQADYSQAVTWMEKNQPEDAELLRFKEEASALLNANRGN